MMKKGYFIGLTAGCVLLLLGCSNQEKNNANNPDTPAVTDSTGITDGQADVAGKNTDAVKETTNPEGQNGGSNNGTVGQDEQSSSSGDAIEQTADVTGQTALSADKKTDSNNQEDIGMDEAKKIALKKANLKEKDGSWKEEKQEHENGRLVYDLEFVSGKTEYEFEIDAQDGKILEYKKESVKR